jgi:hypothetical protein
VLREVWDGVNARRFGGTGLAVAAALLPKSRPLISTKPITDETGSPAAVHRSCDLYETQWVAPTGAEHELHPRPSAAWLPVLRLTSSVAAGSIG